MASYNLVQFLRVVTPRMATIAIWHPWRAAYRTAHAKGLRGLALWHAVWQGARAPLPPSPPSPEAFALPGVLIGSPEVGDNHVTLHTAEGALRIEALAPDLLRIRWCADGEFPQPFSYSVVEDIPPGAPLHVEDAPGALTLCTDALMLSVDKVALRLDIADADGHSLLQALTLGQTPEGWLLWQAQTPTDTAFYGLGEKATALNLAGQHVTLWNSDPNGYDRGDDPIYMSVPFWIGLTEGRAVGVFYDNTHRSWIELGETATYRAVGGEMRFYVMVGSPAHTLELYTTLTGRMKLPPLWTLGFHQSRWSYYPEARVREVATEFRKRRIPCDAIHLDIHYMDDYRCFTWNLERFPNPKTMIGDLHAQGFKVITIIDPGVKVDQRYSVDQEGLERDAFMKYPDGKRFVGPVWPGDCHFPDFSNPDVRAWWGGLYAGLLDKGVDGFWNDMNEPALTTQRTRETFPDTLCHHADGAGADHAALHNIYGLLMARASVEGLSRLRPDRRPFVLSRSGWAGLQRYAAHWTADNKSTWDHLRLCIQIVLNLGLSGIPFTGPDVGGFTGGPSPELFARWMEVGAWMPFFRVHSMLGSPPQEPWAFGPEVEAIARKYIGWRYRLLPYLYTAVWQSTQTGIPIVRALSLAYPDDRTTYSLDNEFLFGDSLLVAPVLEEGATERDVYLPAGRWHDFWTGAWYNGPATIAVAAPLDALPLFVRAGSVIPLWPVMQYVGEHTMDTLTLRVYLGAGESFHYEDDGESTAGVHHLTTWHLAEAWTLTAQALAAGYLPSYNRLEIIVFGLEAAPSAVQIEGSRLLSWEFDSNLRSLALQADYADDYEIRINP